MKNKSEKSFMIRLLSLFTVFLILASAAVMRNGKIFGHEIQATEDSSSLENDTVTVLSDGTMVINTTYLAKDVTGYAGPVPLKIYIDASGVITDIEALPNSESPGFFKRAKTLLDVWIGKNINDALDTEADAVTGATISSNAIMANVKHGLEYVKNNDRIATGNDFNTEHSGITVCGIFAIIVALSGAIVPLATKNKRLRLVQLILNVAVLGLWTGTFVSYALFLRIFSEGITLASVATLAAPLIMTVTALVYPLFGKNGYYCAHICPFGSAQELAGNLWHNKIKMSPGLITCLTTFRIILWATLMILMLTGIWAAWVDYELFTAFMYSSVPVWVIVAAIIFLLLSVITPRPYCRFVCPTGVLIKE